jgi:hypothetical protein
MGEIGKLDALQGINNFAEPRITKFQAGILALSLDDELSSFHRLDTLGVLDSLKMSTQLCNGQSALVMLPVLRSFCSSGLHFLGVAQKQEFQSNANTLRFA